MKPLLLTHRQVWLELSRRVEELDHMVRAELDDWPEAGILDEIPGFGPLVSLAVLGYLDDPHRFSPAASRLPAMEVWYQAAMTAGAFRNGEESLGKAAARYAI